MYRYTFSWLWIRYAQDAIRQARYVVSNQTKETNTISGQHKQQRNEITACCQTLRFMNTIEVEMTPLFSLMYVIVARSRYG